MLPRLLPIYFVSVLVSTTVPALASPRTVGPRRLARQANRLSRAFYRDVGADLIGLTCHPAGHAPSLLINTRPVRGSTPRSRAPALSTDTKLLAVDSPSPL
jgi:hypothetical protein